MTLRDTFSYRKTQKNFLANPENGLKPRECATPRVNPNINYRLWVIMMSQCRFINCNKCITVVQDIVRYECRV